MTDPSTSMWRPARIALTGLTICGALVGVLDGHEPTGLRVVDVVLVATFGALVVLAASRAHRWAILLAVAPTTLLVDGSRGWAGVATATLVSVLLGFAPDRFRHSRWRQPVGGVAGVGLMLAFSNLNDRWFTHSSAVVAGLASVMVAWSAWTGLQRDRRRQWRRAAIVVGGLTVLFGALAGFGAAQARWHVRAAERHLSVAIDAARSGDRSQLETELEQAHHELASARGWVDAPWQLPARMVPVASQNLRTASNTLRLVDDVVRTLQPAARLAELDGLTFEGGRLDLAAIAQLADQVRPSAAAVAQTIEFAGADQSPWLARPVTDGLARITTTLDRFGSDLVKASDALDALPDMLGADRPRRYLVIFVTPSESRGGGGFPGQTAELTFDNGTFHLGAQHRSTEIAAPAGQQWTIEGADEYLQRYGTFRVASTWQNITMSPDFPTVAGVASQAYEQFTGTTLDGVIRIGPRAFASLLAVTGPVTVEGLDRPLDETNALDFFAREQYVDAFATNDDRVDFLGRFVEQVVSQLSATTLSDPRAISDAFSPALRTNDVAMWSSEPEVQSALAALKLDGTVPDVDAGDTLFVTQHDLLPNKVDAYSHRAIQYDVTIDAATQQLTGDLQVSLRNEAPTDLPEYAIGTGSSGLPPGSMRELITIYSPHLLTDFRVNGSAVDLLLQTELERYAYQVEVEVAPGQTTTITASVSGSATWPYQLTVPVVPSVNLDSVEVRVNGEVTSVDALDRALRVRAG